jgi:hypothetical protein
MYEQQASLAQENKGLVEIEQYGNAALPEDYEITEVLDDVIMAEYADIAGNGREIMRNGLFIPEEVVDQKAWRVGRVIITGPNVRNKTLRTPGATFIFPGDRGLRSIRQDGKQILFINEDRIFGVCVQKTDANTKQNVKGSKKSAR